MDTSEVTTTGKEGQEKVDLSFDEIVEFLKDNFGQDVEVEELSKASPQAVLEVYSFYLDASQMPWRHPGGLSTSVGCIFQEATQKVMAELLKHLLHGESLNVELNDLREPTPERTRLILSALSKKLTSYKDEYSFWKIWKKHKDDIKREYYKRKTLEEQLKQLSNRVDKQDLEIKALKEANKDLKDKLEKDGPCQEVENLKKKIQNFEYGSCRLSGMNKRNERKIADNKEETDLQLEKLHGLTHSIAEVLEDFLSSWHAVLIYNESSPEPTWPPPAYFTNLIEVSRKIKKTITQDERRAR